LSKAGNLLGHVALGRDIIISAAKKIRKFPGELLLQIEHIMLTQQDYSEGKKQINPMFKEALIVSMITSLDSRMSIMKKIIEEDKDDDDFTSQYNFFKTTIYKKN
jgi:3'-5' exoribonuclease